MKGREEFLTYLKQHPFYPMIIQELKKRRPIIPAFNPQADNTEVWKSISSQIQGYELALSLFNINLE